MILCRVWVSSNCFLQERVNTIYLPGQMGDCEILADHAPVMQVLRPGLVKITREEKKGYIFISGGVFVMYGKSASLFTSRAVTLPDEKEETLSRALRNFPYKTLGSIDFSQ
jgi:F0F1-type ATP synthase epsilon subunit